MKKIVKKLVTAYLIVAMTVSLIPESMAQGQTGGKTLKSRLFTASGEMAEPSQGRVTVIVQMEGDSVLAADGIAEMGIDVYQNTIQAKKREKNALSMQRKVQEKIEDEVDNTEVGFTYTNVINGFSMDIDAADIPKVKAIDGVKAVYLSQAHEAEQTLPADTTTVAEVETCCEMMGVDFMQENGYTGKGKVVAVIDSELDVNHEMFSGEIQNPKYTKADIKKLIEEKKLNINVEGNQVYRSAKIPYAYNYSNRNADVYSSDENVQHGTHVSGIAVGNAGKTPDGETFTGVAPNAQLLFCGVPDLMDDNLLAALDDASKMDVDAINCSWGTDYKRSLLYSEVMERLKGAGVAVYVAAGNADRGDGKNSLRTTEIDYSTAGEPTCVDSVSSVASADVTRRWISYYTMKVGEHEIDFTEHGSDLFSEKFSESTYGYVYCGYGSEKDFQDVEVTGKIALVRGGSSDGTKLKYAAKAANAAAAGATGIIIAHTEDDIAVRTDSIDQIPCIVIANSDLDILMNANEKKLTANSVKHAERKEYSDGKISSFSSWGTDSSLELEPDISAPGGQIYSSIPNDKYETESGTSMAAPHMTGTWALFKEFLEKNYSDVNMSKVDLGNYLLMSSADIVYQDKEKTVPYSPRKQGAGFVNLKGATETPVYLEGTSGKCSISLKDQLEDSFTLSFKAKNLSDKAITYDSVSLYVMTDDYEEKDGQYLIADRMKPFSYQCDLPQQVTVPAGGEEEITLTVNLNSEETRKNMEIFTNGFYVDGYVVLDSAEESIPEISIPYTGFYGDWTKASIVDGKFYEEHKNSGTYLASLLPKIDDRGKKSYIYCKLGQNDFTEDESYASEEYVGISPNGDCYFDVLCPAVTFLRNVSDMELKIKNEKNEIVAEHTFEAYDVKYAPVYFPYREMNNQQLEEGNYTCTITAKLDYEREKTESVTMKFYVDTTDPEIKNARLYTEDGRTYLSIQASDNKYLMGAEVYDNATEGDEFCDSVAFEPGKEGTATFDVTGQKLSELSVGVLDYTYNCTEKGVSELLSAEEKTPTPTPSLTPIVTPTVSPAATQEPAVKPSSSPAPTVKLGRTKIKSVKNNKKKTITIKLTKTKNAKKYEICYATNKKFTKAKKKTTKKLTYTLKKLKKGKIYYIKVRALNGDQAGKWSKISKVKVKK